MIETIREGCTIGLLEILASREDPARYSGLLRYPLDGEMRTVSSIGSLEQSEGSEGFFREKEAVTRWAREIIRRSDLRSALKKFAEIYSLKEAIVMDPHVDGLWTIAFLSRRGSKAMKSMIPSEVYFSSREKAEEARKKFFSPEDDSNFRNHVRRRMLE